MKYQTPEMELVFLAKEDIITNSFGEEDNGNTENEPVISPDNDWT